MKTALKIFSIVLFPFLIGLSLPEKNQPKPDSADNFYPEQLDGPFTGGFGEQTCHSCHFDYDLNREEGSLSVTGIDETFIPGENHEITVTVESEQLEVGGFQITARHKDGSQAGEFIWDGDRLMLTPSISDDIQYLQHSDNGTRPTGDQEVSWSFTWQAPDENSKTVIVNIASNAGNDDDSAFGDWIYVKELTTSPAR